MANGHIQNWVMNRLDGIQNETEGQVRISPRAGVFQ
jgi:hypothetical protein